MQARRRAAELLRQFASGRLTNDEFEDALPDFDDQAIRRMFRFAWGLYDDLSIHRLRGKYRLSRLDRREVARWVLFLRSGLPYEWPKGARRLGRMQQEIIEGRDIRWWQPDHTVLEGLPFFGRRARALREPDEQSFEERLKRRIIIDDRIWPFRRMADYKAALRNPPYLAGA